MVGAELRRGRHAGNRGSDARPDELAAETKPPRAECCVRGPEVLEFDQAGNVLGSDRVLATAPGYVVMIYIKPAMWLQVQQVMICLLLTVAYTLTLSAAFGSFFSRTATSTVAVYVMLMALFLGPLLIWLGREAPFGQTVVEAALAINPMGAALSVIAMPGFAQYELIPLSWWMAGAVSLIAFGTLGVRTFRLMLPT